ncbi:hypothetical protein BDF21DRAFT_394660 [Thamnidium elegans]|nr:hypothetical protein BDF21DRAFT_394660 [Thamnidium elegans]
MNIIAIFNILIIILSVVKSLVLTWSGTPKPFNRNKKLATSQKKLGIVFSDKKTPVLVKYAHVSSEHTPTFLIEPKHQASDKLRLLLQEYPTETIKKASTLKDQVVTLGTNQNMKSKATVKTASNATTEKCFPRPALSKRVVPELINLFEDISSKNTATPVHYRKPNLLSKPKTTTGVSLIHIQNSFIIVDYEENQVSRRRIANYEATVAACILNGRRYLAGLQ